MRSPSQHQRLSTTLSAAGGSEPAKEKTDKLGRPANWWKLPPVDGAALAHHTDRYGSAVIEDAACNSSATDTLSFSRDLATSMGAWRAAGVRAVWLRLATEACALLPVAVEQGFEPHHAARDHITLTAWLKQGSPSRLPPGPSHFVGVAGLVLHVDPEDKDGGGQVLVIQEKSGPSAGLDLWKLPGGLVDPQEDISSGAVREVLEETGVRATFQRLMTVQENHSIRGPGREGSTDLFCVCLLTPALNPDGSLPQPVAQEAEIAACQWISLDKLLAQPLYSDGIFRVMIQSALAAASAGGMLLALPSNASTLRVCVCVCVLAPLCAWCAGRRVKAHRIRGHTYCQKFLDPSLTINDLGFRISGSGFTHMQ